MTTALITSMATRRRYSYGHSSGIGHTISRWIVHAAIFRILWRMPLLIVIILAALALAYWFYRDRR